METNENMLAEYKKVALKVRERVQKELPIINGLLDAIDSSEDNIQILPQLVHTIAVIAPTKSYVFLDGVYDIYEDLINKGKVDTISHDLWKAVKKTHSVVSRLYTQEKEEFLRQLNHHRVIFEQRKLEELGIVYKNAKGQVRKKRNWEKELKNHELEITSLLEQEKEYFQHVECDISSSIKSFIFLLIIGYQPTDKQMATMRNMMSLSKRLLAEQKTKHENSLETCKQILGVGEGVQ